MEKDVDKQKIANRQDIIIIVIVSLATIFMIIGTAFWVKAKYENNLLAEANLYLDIVNNSTYKYEMKDGKINFYSGTESVANYTCVTKDDCDINVPDSTEFTFNNEDIVAINDGKKFILFNINTNAIYYTLDMAPKKLLTLEGKDSEYGSVEKNEKYGVVNKKGGLVIDFDYDTLGESNKYNSNTNQFVVSKSNKYGVINLNDITVIPLENKFVTMTNNYIVVVSNSKVIIYDSKATKLDESILVEEKDKITAEENNEYLFIYVTSENNAKKTYKFNISEQKITFE